MNGNTLVGGGAASPNPGPSWRAVGTGDFNDDGRSDILWQNASSGQVSIWEMDGSSLIGGGAVGPNPGPAWRAIGTGDFNGDSHSDILFQNTSSGQVSIWEMSGTNLIGGGRCQPQSGACLESDWNGRLQWRRLLRHPVAERQRSGIDLGHEREHHDWRRSGQPQSWKQLALSLGRFLLLGLRDGEPGRASASGGAGPTAPRLPIS